MIKSDPIIAVTDVVQSSAWYQSLFGCKSIHGGKEFDVLVDEKEEVILCLHLWGEHEHPTMMDKNAPGNGLILYFRTDEIDAVWAKAQETGNTIEKELHLSPNSNKREFSLRDPDGYYLMISEYHEYRG